MKYKAKFVGRIDIQDDSRIVLDHAEIRGEDYSGRKLMQFCTIGCRLEACRFNKAEIQDTQFGSGREMSEFVECIFNGATLIGVGGYTRFIRCSFRDVDLRDWICNGAEFVDCTFSGRLRRGIFSGTVPQEMRSDVNREHNEFRGNDFSGMDMIGVDFRAGIDLTQQRLPTGPQYLYVPDAAAALERAKTVVWGWIESEHRKSATVIITALSDSVKDGQQQLFLRPEEWAKCGSFTREGVEKVFSLLRGESE